MSETDDFEVHPVSGQKRNKRTGEVYSIPPEAGEIVGECIEFQLPGEPRSRELAIWWMNTAWADFEKQTPKMHEYGGRRDSGSSDLIVMGDTLGTLLRWGGHGIEVALEMACWFYVVGKVSRLISDYQQQNPGKPDTWHDISVYAMMARRIQAVGRWP
jgi:hypothetical protein